jgi:hypothetical protein
MTADSKRRLRGEVDALERHAAASAAADERDRATWEWARSRPDWRDHPDSWVIPKPEDLARAERYTRDAFRRAAQARSRLRGTSASAAQHGRAPRASSTRRSGSRRTSSSSRTSGADPGDNDPDPEPAPRLCAGCGEPLVGLAPQARTHGDTCRKRAARARSRAERPARPIWPAPRVEPLPVLAILMAEPPHGVVTEAAI